MVVLIESKKLWHTHQTSVSFQNFSLQIRRLEWRYERLLFTAKISHQSNHVFYVNWAHFWIAEAQNRENTALPKCSSCSYWPIQATILIPPFQIIIPQQSSIPNNKTLKSRIQTRNPIILSIKSKIIAPARATPIIRLPKTPISPWKFYAMEFSPRSFQLFGDHT